MIFSITSSLDDPDMRCIEDQMRVVFQMIQMPRRISMGIGVYLLLLGMGA